MGWDWMEWDGMGDGESEGDGKEDGSGVDSLTSF